MELRIRQLHSLFYPHFSSDFFCFYTVSSAFSAFSTAAADSASAAASSVSVSSPGRTRCASTIGSMVCAISRWIMSRLRSRNRDGRSGAIATSVTSDSRPSIIRSLPGVSFHSSQIRSKSRWKMILTLRLAASSRNANSSFSTSSPSSFSANCPVVPSRYGSSFSTHSTTLDPVRPISMRCVFSPSVSSTKKRPFS